MLPTQDPTSCDSSIDELAHQITAIGLGMPAILLLEAHKPLAFLMSQLILIAQPSITLFLSDATVERYAAIFGDDRQVEQLIVTLEQHIATSKTGTDR